MYHLAPTTKTGSSVRGGVGDKSSKQYLIFNLKKYGTTGSSMFIVEVNQPQVFSLFTHAYLNTTFSAIFFIVLNVYLILNDFKHTLVIKKKHCKACSLTLSNNS